MGDSSLSVPSEQAPDPYGPHCRSQEDRAERFTRMFNDIFARRCYVGWNWCGWMDSWKDLQDSKQHGGLQTPFGEFHDQCAKRWPNSRQPYMTSPRGSRQSDRGARELLSLS